MSDVLPLTCSRKGTCCHGNQVWLNAWELACLAAAKELTPAEFQTAYCNHSGLRLRFDGATDARGKAACKLHHTTEGCTAHHARPLACRLFPLGRQIQTDTVSYFYETDEFPCLNGCSEVLQLPQLSVASYLAQQQTKEFEAAQTHYVEVMQNTADIALMLLLDTGMAETEKRATIGEWEKRSQQSVEQLVQTLDQSWLDLLRCPKIPASIGNPHVFIETHEALLQESIQARIDGLARHTDTQVLAEEVFTASLLLAACVGASHRSLGKWWIEIAHQQSTNGE